MTKNDLLSIPPVNSPFKVGDIVSYTNDYGIVFHGLKIIGFCEPDEYGRYVHFDTDSWWFPHSECEVTLEPSQLFNLYDRHVKRDWTCHVEERLLENAKEIAESDFIDYIGGTTRTKQNSLLNPNT